MQTLPPALAGLANYPQFILYRLAPSAARPGKVDKLPVDWRTGQVSSAHNPAAWTTFENAAAHLPKADGVGFVFTPSDPFFFLDIDGALLPSGEWSEVAQFLCKAFPGAAVEVSGSGSGLHIFGTGQCPPHGCKNAEHHLELYTEGRFVALTGAHAVGDCLADMSAVLPWLVKNFFPYASDSERPTEWTTGPRDDWRGPTDDDDLIRRACNSRSAAAVFGSKASFADLWEANVTALGAIFPHATQPFDASSADAALASHLAFWTGCDMDRMLRLMMRSGLKREKYDRGDYLEKFTIPSAVGFQKDVCQDKPVIAPELPPVGDIPAVAEALPVLREGETYLHPPEQQGFFAGCVYVKAQHKAFTPTGSLLKPDQFKVIYGGHQFVMDNGNEKTTGDAWEAFTQSKVNTCPIVDDCQFRPDLPPGSIVSKEGLRLVNSYVPVPIARMKGDAGPFLTHLEKLLPIERDREILLAYMAACVQHIGEKFQWCPLIQGVEGNGKTFFSRCIEAALGERYTHWPRADQISAKFNAWMEGKLFIAVEDIYLPEDRGEVLEILKPMITNTRQPTEPKGVDSRTSHICANFLMNSNHKEALRKTRNDRRIANFFCAQQHESDLERDGMAGDYMPALYNWLKADGKAIVADFLHSYPIPLEFNPAGHCQRAPKTSSTEEAIGVSIGGVEQEILEAIAAGTPGFIGGWVSSHAVGRLLDKLGRSRSLTHRKREQLLADLGYVKHPNLVDGRVNNVVAPDGTKPVLFVKKDSILCNYANPADVARAYSAAQMGGLEFGARVA